MSLLESFRHLFVSGPIAARSQRRALPVAVPVPPKPLPSVPAEADRDEAQPAASEFNWHEHMPLLTAPGGTLADNPLIRDGLASRVAYFRTGLLLVLEDYVGNEAVDEFVQHLRLNGLRVTQTRAVPLEQMKSAYFAANSRRTRARSQAKTSNREQRAILSMIRAAHAIKATDIHIHADPVAASTTVYRRQNRVRENKPRIYDYEFGHQLGAVLWGMLEDHSHQQHNAEIMQSGRLNSETYDLPADISGTRVQYNPSGQGGRAIYMRLLWDTPKVQSFSAMGFHQKQQQLLSDLCLIDKGLIIASGQTGSGKSTTLALMLNNRQALYGGRQNIVTVEDPREFHIRGANQIALPVANDPQERSTSYIRSIAALLRSDPDASMVTEFRCPASTDAVMQIGEAGTPLFTSGHSSSNPELIRRLQAMGIDLARLTNPDVLRGFVNQRLVGCLCPKCAIPLSKIETARYLDYGLDEARFNRFRDLWGDPRLANREGCQDCNNGYIGSTVLAEVGKPDHAYLTRLVRGEYEAAEGYWREQYLHKQGHAALKILEDQISVVDAEMLVGEIGRADIAAGRRHDA